MDLYNVPPLPYIDCIVLITARTALTYAHFEDTRLRVPGRGRV
jgi:hypothetical protein